MGIMWNIYCEVGYSMRCYTFQNIKIVTWWMELFKSGVDIVTPSNIDNDNFHFVQSRTKDCYDGNDFIYTFYRYAYDVLNYPKAWLKDNYYLTSVLKWCFPGFSYDNMIMVDLDVPGDIGIFGEIDSFSTVSEHYVQSVNKTFEYVLPYLDKDWIIEYYSFKKIPEVTVNNGIEIVPANYTNRGDRLIKSNAPLIWDRSACNESYGIADMIQDIPMESSVPFASYNAKCRQAFYGIEETHLFK